MSFVHVLIGLFFKKKITVEFEGSLYVLDTNPLSDMWFVNIFYQIIAFHLFNNVSNRAHILMLTRFNPSILLILILVLVVRTPSPTSYVFFLKFYNFTFYI